MHIVGSLTSTHEHKRREMADGRQSVCRVKSREQSHSNIGDLCAMLPPR